MGGGLMQLVAYGAQDFYLTGNPQITFFKVVYRRHTNFATESIEQTFNGTAVWGSRAVVNLQRSGDLVTKMYLRLTVPGADSNNLVKGSEWAWVSRLGHFMLADIIMEIGGTQIDKLYGDWLNVWYELARNFAQDRGYAQMIGDTPELTTFSNVHDSAVLYIPFHFACCRNDGLALPVIALQYHDIKITVDFAPFNQMINYSASLAPYVNQLQQLLQIQNCSLFVDYVYLDNEERKRFAQASHEYLFEQLQFTGSETIAQQNTKVRLNLNHPCKELVWNATSGQFFGGTFLAYIPTNMELARVNATKRFALRLAQYGSTGGVTGTDNNVLVTSSENKLQFNGGLSGVNNGISITLHSGTYRLKDIFDEINAVFLSPLNPDIDNITILGRLLTVEEMSVPTNVLFAGCELGTVNSGSSAGLGPGVWVNQEGHVVPVDGAAANDVTLYQWDNYGCYLDGSRNPSAHVLLQLNGHDRFSIREGAYFNYVQPWQCHTNTPADGINVYSFALNPEQHQPSGTCNFSRIDNATINIQYDGSFQYANTNSSFNIYATNYNVLRIMSGMGGLAYSN